MSSFSTQLRTYIEQASQYENGLSIREKIEKGRKKLFDFDYPIFDESYRNVFETNFIRNFYMREIGFEVEELFKFKLETWLLINMPYYNKLFESEMIKYDPLKNSEMSVTHNKTNDKTQKDIRDVTHSSNTDGTNKNTNSQNASGQASDDNFDRNLESDNPDSRLNLTSKDGEGIIEYASRITENNENNKRTTSSNTSSESQDQSNVNTNAQQNDTNNSNINEVEDYIQNRVGKIGVQSYSKMIQEYRSAFLRIERDIFKEMNELFMLIYG